MDSMHEFLQTRPYLTGFIGSVLFVYLTKKFYFEGAKCHSEARLDGKTAIVTGSNTGIGKETAIDFARRGSRVILACRDPARAQKACDEIRALTKNPNVVVEIVDLSSFESMRAFTDRINKNEERIDILVHNAAVIGPRWLSKDGYELTLAVNHLAPFFLTNLLLKKIKSSAPSRIVNVNALYDWGCKNGALDLDDIQMEKSYDALRAYSRSKICNILFTRSLAKRLEGTKVTVNALHPGVIKTEISRNFDKAYKIPPFVFKLIEILLTPFQWWFWKSLNQGAQTQIYCAVAEELEGVNGLYFCDCKQRAYHPFVLDENLAEKVWTLSEKLTGVKYD